MVFLLLIHIYCFKQFLSHAHRIVFIMLGRVVSALMLCQCGFISRFGGSFVATRFEQHKLLGVPTRNRGSKCGSRPQIDRGRNKLSTA